MNLRVRRALVNGLTLTVLLCGVGALLAAMAERIWLASELIIVAAILDGLDGSMARWLRANTAFGERLDTYVDTIAFGVAPAVLAYQAVWGDYGVWGVGVASAIVLAAVLRFTRGCSYPSPSGSHVFRGLPIPVSATWIALTVLILEEDVLDLASFGPERDMLAVALWTVALGLLLLQVSNVRYVKPSRLQLRRGIITTLLLVVVLRRPVAVVAGAMVAALLWYVVQGLVRHREAAHLAAEEGEEHISLS